jgi:hypothetical protein
MESRRNELLFGAFSVRVNFSIYDKDELELDSDSENVLDITSGASPIFDHPRSLTPTLPRQAKNESRLDISKGDDRND